MGQTITYRGDCSAAYDPDTGTGLVGKVLGSNLAGWFVASAATYDPATDTTTVVCERLKRPDQRLDELTA